MPEIERPIWTSVTEWKEDWVCIEDEIDFIMLHYIKLPYVIQRLTELLEERKRKEKSNGNS